MVLLAPVEPVIRAGIHDALGDACRITEVPETGAALVAAGRRLGARAVVDRRDTVAELAELPLTPLVVGASSGTYDVLVVREGRLEQWWNPSPAELVALIAAVD